MILLIDSIKSIERQFISHILPNGEYVDLTFRYQTQQQAWFVGIEYKQYKNFYKRIVCSIDLLEAEQNILPFTFSCISQDKSEPWKLTDFESGRVELYIIDREEINNIKNELWVNL